MLSIDTLRPRSDLHAYMGVCTSMYGPGFYEISVVVFINGDPSDERQYLKGLMVNCDIWLQ